MQVTSCDSSPNGMIRVSFSDGTVLPFSQRDHNIVIGSIQDANAEVPTYVVDALAAFGTHVRHCENVAWNKHEQRLYLSFSDGSVQTFEHQDRFQMIVSNWLYKNSIVMPRFQCAELEHILTSKKQIALTAEIAKLAQLRRDIDANMHATPVDLGDIVDAHKKSKKCTCGSASIGAQRHSDWCDVS